MCVLCMSPSVSLMSEDDVLLVQTADFQIINDFSVITDGGGIQTPSAANETEGNLRLGASECRAVHAVYRCSA